MLNTMCTGKIDIVQTIIQSDEAKYCWRWTNVCVYKRMFASEQFSQTHAFKNITAG